MGDGVNIASRLQEYAQECSIVISGKVYSDVKNKAGINTNFIGNKKLKNVDDPVKVYEVLSGEGEQKEIVKKESKKVDKKYLYYLLAGTVIVMVAIMIWKYLPLEYSPAAVELE